MDQLIPVTPTSTPVQWSGAAALIAPEPWVQDALCAQVDPEPFFPEKGGSTKPAKDVCRRCDVIAECLDYALRNNEEQGIYGGTSPQERRKLAKGRAA